MNDEDYHKVANPCTSPCFCCDRSVPAKPSIFQQTKDFISLYSVGIYELVRQIVWASPHSGSYANLKTCLATLQQQSPIIIVTGGTTGIGRSLLDLVRSAASYVILLTHPLHDVSNDEDYQITVDFSNRDSTIQATDTLLKYLSTLPKRPVILFHCAGVYNPSVPCRGNAASHTSAQTTFLVNAVMPSLFFHHLRHMVDVLISIGSSAQCCTPTMDEEICPLSTSLTPQAAYAVSKLSLLAITEDWAQKWGKRAITIHPGVVNTSLYDGEPGFVGALLRFAVRYFAWSPLESAERVLSIVGAANLSEIKPNGSLDNDKFPCSLPSYWDAVSMRPSNVPPHSQPSSCRAVLAKWIYAHNHSPLAQ